MQSQRGKIWGFTRIFSGPPFPYICYDLPNSVNCTPRLFADDICFIFEAGNPVSLQNLINSELNKVDTWCCTNKLTVNPSKST